MIGFMIWLVNFLVQAISIVVIVEVFLSYFLSPFHPLRQSFDRFVGPLLAPIRQVVPPVGGLDLSPIILIVLVQLSGKIITMLLSTFNR
jgi:YggT family protein